jgi:hypothetical protein
MRCAAVQPTGAVAAHANPCLPIACAHPTTAAAAAAAAADAGTKPSAGGGRLLSIDDLFEERGAAGAREKRARDSAFAVTKVRAGTRQGPGCNGCASSEDDCESVSEIDDQIGRAHV